MSREIDQSIRDAQRALENLILTLERYIEELKPVERDTATIARLTSGVGALRDSAGIYLTWARQYARLVGEGEYAGLGRSSNGDLEDFLDEGGGSFENPLFWR